MRSDAIAVKIAVKRCFLPIKNPCSAYTTRVSFMCGRRDLNYPIMVFRVLPDDFKSSLSTFKHCIVISRAAAYCGQECGQNSASRGEGSFQSEEKKQPLPIYVIRHKNGLSCMFSLYGIFYLFRLRTAHGWQKWRLMGFFVSDII